MIKIDKRANADGTPRTQVRVVEGYRPGLGRPTKQRTIRSFRLNNLEGEELEAIAMENPAIRKALTMEETFWRSERERRFYELREKAMRDELVMLEGARAEGKTLKMKKPHSVFKKPFMRAYGR